MRVARGWPVALTVLALACAMGVPAAAGDAADAWARQRDERRYVEVSGRTVLLGDDRYFLGVAEPFGALSVPVTSDERALLVARDDPSDWRTTRDRARSDRAVAPLAAVVALGVVSLLAALAMQREVPVDLRRVRLVAFVARAAPAPPPAAVSGVGRDALPLAAVGVLLVCWAAFPASRAADAWPAPARTVTSTGVVGQREPGHLTVRFHDERVDGTSTRPLTGAEMLRVSRPGDTMLVSYRVPRGDFEDAVAFAVTAVVASAAGLAMVAFAAAWPRRLRRAALTDPVSTEVVAWTREARGTTWLVVAPAGATCLADLVAMPLRKGVVVPPALAGPVWVHGRLRPGRVAVLRAPDGTAYWPSQPCRGPARLAFSWVDAHPGA